MKDCHDIRSGLGHIFSNSGTWLRAGNKYSDIRVSFRVGFVSKRVVSVDNTKSCLEFSD